MCIYVSCWGRVVLVNGLHACVSHQCHHTCIRGTDGDAIAATGECESDFEPRCVCVCVCHVEVVWFLRMACMHVHRISGITLHAYAHTRPRWRCYRRNGGGICRRVQSCVIFDQPVVYPVSCLGPCGVCAGVYACVYVSHPMHRMECTRAYAA